jgi:hypothetical protein
LIEGQQNGPHTVAQIRLSHVQGQITAELPAWYEGLPEWVTVEDVLKAFPAVPPPSPVIPPVFKGLKSIEPNLGEIPAQVHPGSSVPPPWYRRSNPVAMLVAIGWLVPGIASMTIGVSELLGDIVLKPLMLAGLILFAIGPTYRQKGGEWLAYSWKGKVFAWILLVIFACIYVARWIQLLSPSTPN